MVSNEGIKRGDKVRCLVNSMVLTRARIYTVIDIHGGRIEIINDFGLKSTHAIKDFVKK